MTNHGKDAEACERLAQLLSRSSTRRQIVALLLEGKSRKVIAGELQRSPYTIDAHIKVLYRAIGENDRGRLMVLASRLADAPPPPLKIGTVRSAIIMRDSL